MPAVSRVFLNWACIALISIDLVLASMNMLQLWVGRYWLTLVCFVVLAVNNNSLAMSRLRGIPFDPAPLPFTRVLYGVVCLFTAVQHFLLIDYGLEPHNLRYSFAYYGLDLRFTDVVCKLFSIVYLVAILGVIFNCKIRVAWCLMFFVGGAIIPFSLETFIKNIINFWCMFISLEAWSGRKSEEPNYDAGCVFMIGVSLALLSTFAGVFKLVDPVWLSGLGLYFSMNISYFVPEHLWFLLDNKVIMVAGNWMTIIVEVITLPLYLFSKTRFVGLILLGVLALFLAYPMGNIGLVGGPTILTALPLLLAIHPSILFSVSKYVGLRKLGFTSQSQ